MRGPPPRDLPTGGGARRPCERRRRRRSRRRPARSSWAGAARQHDMDAQALVGVELSPNRAALRLDDGPADGQPHAKTGCLGGDEGLEDILEIALLDPDARVPN